jgi:hypothetical protein
VRRIGFDLRRGFSISVGGDGGGVARRLRDERAEAEGLEVLMRLILALSP